MPTKDDRTIPQLVLVPYDDQDDQQDTAQDDEVLGFSLDYYCKQLEQHYRDYGFKSKPERFGADASFWALKEAADANDEDKLHILLLYHTHHACVMCRNRYAIVHSLCAFDFDELEMAVQEKLYSPGIIRDFLANEDNFPDPTETPLAREFHENRRQKWLYKTIYTTAKTLFKNVIVGNKGKKNPYTGEYYRFVPGDAPLNDDSDDTLMSRYATDEDVVEHLDQLERLENSLAVIFRSPNYPARTLIAVASSILDDASDVHKDLPALIAHVNQTSSVDLLEELARSFKDMGLDTILLLPLAERVQQEASTEPKFGSLTTDILSHTKSHLLKKVRDKLGPVDDDTQPRAPKKGGH